MIGVPRSTSYRRLREELAAGDGIAASTGPVPPLGTLVVPGEGSDPDTTLRESVAAIRQSHPAYGYRRETEVLRRSGLRISKKWVQCVLRALLATHCSGAPSRRGLGRTMRARAAARIGGLG
jgi:hypothetical protein